MDCAPFDVWSMGAILYRAISGQQVFSGPNLAAVLKSMAVDRPAEIDTLVEGLPEELVEIIHRCLARNPDDRYASAEELSEERRALVAERSRRIETLLDEAGLARGLEALRPAAD